MSVLLKLLEEQFQSGHRQEVERDLEQLDSSKLSSDERVRAASLASELGREDLSRNFLFPIVSKQAAEVIQAGDSKAREALRDNMLFFGLADEVLDKILSDSHVIKLSAGDAFEDFVHPILVVVSGKLFVKRERERGVFQEIVLSNTYSFGGFDVSLGLGRCVEVIAIDDTELIRIDESVFRRLRDELPHLQQHVAMLEHNAVVLDRASRTETPKADSGYVQNTLRRGGRCDILSQSVQVDTGVGVFQIKDVSVSGLFLLGAASLEVDQTYALSIEGLSTHVRAKVVRKSVAGVGLAIAFESALEKETWLSYFTHVSAKTFVKERSEQLFPVTPALAAQIQIATNHYSAQILALGPSLCVLESGAPLNPLQKAILLVTFDPTKRQETLRLPLTVTEMTHRGFKCSMGKLDDAVVRVIESFLDKQEERSLAKSEEVSAQKPQVVSVELNLETAQDFIDVYQEHLSQSALILTVRDGQPALNQQVRVRLRAHLGAKQEMIYLEGKATRALSQQKMLVSLYEFEAYTARKLQRMAAMAYQVKNISPMDRFLDRFWGPYTRLSVLMAVTLALIVPLYQRVSQNIPAAIYHREDSLSQLLAPDLAYRGIIWEVVDENRSYMRGLMSQQRDKSLWYWSSEGEPRPYTQSDEAELPWDLRDLANQLVYP